MNLLPKIKLSVKDIRHQLSNIHLSFLKNKLYQVENEIQFPYFVNSFYDYIIHTNTIPNQGQFFQAYYSEHKHNLPNMDNEMLLALKARLYRAYPSYVRDMLFAKLLYDKTDFEDIIYDIDLDINEGVDVLVIERGIKYAINLYVATYRSKNYRKIKHDRHPNKDKSYVDIDLPLDLKHAMKISNLYVYSNKHIINVMNFIIKDQRKK